MTDSNARPGTSRKGPGPASRPKPAPRARRSTKSVVGAVAAVAGAATIAAFGGLWLQMAQGNDPVLAAKASAKKQQVIRKVIVVRKEVPTTSTYGSTGSSYGYSGSSGSYSSGTSAAPVAVAPAPAPAPVVSSPS